MTEKSLSAVDLFFQKYGTGGFPHQRMGQAFCNHFNIQNDTELFYTTDVVKARTKIDEYCEKWQLWTTK